MPHLHWSERRFLPFSLFTALISRSTPSLEMRGQTKNWANLDRGDAGAGTAHGCERATLHNEVASEP
eukprot:4776-Pyramimonas_sp.AAC.2